jgi:hypothetical protein
MISFFRRLAGLSDKHVRESERFRKNLRRFDEKELELQMLHDQLKTIQVKTAERAEEYVQITSSIPPARAEEPEDDVEDAGKV